MPDDVDLYNFSDFQQLPSEVDNNGMRKGVPDFVFLTMYEETEFYESDPIQPDHAVWSPTDSSDEEDNSDEAMSVDSDLSTGSSELRAIDDIEKFDRKIIFSPLAPPLPRSTQLTPSRSALKNREMLSSGSSSSFRVTFADEVMCAENSYQNLVSSQDPSEIDVSFVSINRSDQVLLQEAVLLPTPINRARRPEFSNKSQYSRLRANHISQRFDESLPWVLGCMVYQTPLGKLGLVALFLGLIGFLFAMENTVLWCSAATMVLAGSAAIGVSLFHNLRIQPVSREHSEPAEILIPSPQI